MEIRRFYKYNRGDSSPEPAFVYVINMRRPGTQFFFEMPLWEVLSNDRLDKCDVIRLFYSLDKHFTNRLIIKDPSKVQFNLNHRNLKAQFSYLIKHCGMQALNAGVLILAWHQLNQSISAIQVEISDRFLELLTYCCQFEPYRTNDRFLYRLIYDRFTGQSNSGHEAIELPSIEDYEETLNPIWTTLMLSTIIVDKHSIRKNDKRKMFYALHKMTKADQFFYTVDYLQSLEGDELDKFENRTISHFNSLGFKTYESIDYSQAFISMNTTPDYNYQTSDLYD